MTMKFSGRRFFVARTFHIFCLNLSEYWFNINAQGSLIFALFVNNYLSVYRFLCGMKLSVNRRKMYLATSGGQQWMMRSRF